MLKLSYDEANAVVRRSAGLLRELADENEQLRTELTASRRRDHATKIASDMATRGIIPKEETPAKAEELATGERSLDVLEAALELETVVPEVGDLKKEAGVGGGDAESNPVIDFLTESAYGG